MHLERCICAHIPTLPLQTRLVLVSHRSEKKKISNTAHYALLALPNHEHHWRGWPRDGPVEVPSDGLLLFPYEDAVPLTPDVVRDLARPVHLVVPDGTWGQARQMGKREASLRNLHRVSLPPERLSRYRIRRQHRLDGLSTFEAIARCMGVLEGPEAEARLDEFFDFLMDHMEAAGLERIRMPWKDD